MSHDADSAAFECVRLLAGDKPVSDYDPHGYLRAEIGRAIREHEKGPRCFCGQRHEWQRDRQGAEVTP